MVLRAEGGDSREAESKRRKDPRGWGEGGVRQREDGRWQATLELGVVSGKRKRKYVYGKTKREALQKLAEAKRQSEQGNLVARERLTLAEYLEHWLKTAQPSLRPTTFQRYTELVRLHLVPVLGNQQLSKLRPEHIQTLYAAKLAEGLSRRTVHHIHAVLHRALSQATRWDLAVRNVCELVDPPSVPDEEMQALSPAQARTLLTKASGDPLEALYVLALTTGMRQGELLALRWADVDLSGRSITVVRTIHRIPGHGWYAGPPKSARSRRLIILVPTAVAALEAHRGRQAEVRKAAGSAWQEQDLVFSNGLGRPIETSNLVQRSFFPLLQRAGLPRIRFHDLRHSCASLLLSLGTHPKIVSELLGHSRVSMTLDTYSHALPTLQREAMGGLERLLHHASDRGPEDPASK